jgi:hypothetical protein
VSNRWGVKCSTCDGYIDLGEQDHTSTITTYVPGLDPILCPHCGASHCYGTRDAMDEDGVLLDDSLELE